MSLNVELLEKSFDRVRLNATEFASSFYNYLFTDYPQLKPLFANTTVEDKEKKLMISLVLVIDNLRNFAYMTTLLKDLGERHVRYGTMREHYPMMGAALLKTFESYLGTDWTPEVKQAWIDANEVLVNLMLEGAKYPEEVLKLENPLQQSAKPAVIGFAPQQAAATESSVNLKLLVIIFVVVAGLLSVGILYYYSSSKQDNRQDNSSLEGSIAKTTCFVSNFCSVRN